MLKQLIELSKVRYNAQELSLAVNKHNMPAKKCYESLGFHVKSIESCQMTFDDEAINDEVWDFLRMEMQL